MAKTKLLAVAGNPVLHSLSPEIFNAAFAHAKVNAHYLRLAAFTAEEVLETAREMSFAGLNITSPFKEQMVELVDSVEESAQRIGAINTIISRKGKFIGCNTDYNGVRGALSNAIGNLKGRKAVVLGAGGAARAAIYALTTSGVEVMVVNRTIEKAIKLAKEFGCAYASLSEIEKALESAEILVSCISTGMRVVPKAALKKELVVMDAYYASESALVGDAAKKGCTIVDGREWLLYQAVPTFKRITGKLPPIEIMRKALYGAKRVKKHNIALIGFMGTGKSTIGTILATRLGWVFEDTDVLIEKKEGMSIPQIFMQKGEAAFRKMERALATTLLESSNRIFACGGGFVLDSNNRDALTRSSTTIWLWASPKIAAERAIKQGSRPLLMDKNPVAKARKLLAMRIPLYSQLSEIVINTSARTPEQIAERIEYEINHAFTN